MTFDQSIAIARPERNIQQLILLFHDIGSTPQSMEPLGHRLSQVYPQACIISIKAPQLNDDGPGFQWFPASISNQHLKAQHVSEAIPFLAETIKYWQSRTGTSARETALIGFSQGAIMALECVRTHPLLAGRVVSIAGRFAQLPEKTDERITWFFLHGKEDTIIDYGHTVTAAEHLIALGGDVVADVIPFASHEISNELIDIIIARLSNHIPMRTWHEALEENAKFMPVPEQRHH
ncbi:esterase [Acidihalobacter prosperus]